MKLMRLALVAAAFAMVGGIAMSEDMDIRALQAKLAAQEARINDLQAKMNQSRNDGGAAKGVTSIRKNAVVTIGGTMNARLLATKGKIESRIVPGANNAVTPGNATGGNTGIGTGAYNPVGSGLPTLSSMGKREDFTVADMRIHDAKLDFKIDVNEHVDAYIKLDLHDGNRRSNVNGIAQHYWLRWKNICNSGFGVLVGRDAIKYGDTQAVGQLDTWTKDTSGQIGDVFARSMYINAGDTRGEGMFAYGTMQPTHTMYNWQRTTQITPYWESADKKFKAEVSFVQSLDRLNGSGTVNMVRVDGDGTRNYRSMNYGAGSMTARITWTPIEGLKLVASGLNMYARHTNTGAWGISGNRPTNSNNALSDYGVTTTSNYTALNLAFRWRPCFLKELQIFGQYNHGWNEAWVEDQDSDLFLLGAQYDIGKKWTVFAMGEYLRTKNDQGVVWHKANGWNVYTGVIYKLPYGAEIEAGWRHEEIKYKGRGAYSGTHTKLKADTFYANLGFNF